MRAGVWEGASALQAGARTAEGHRERWVLIVASVMSKRAVHGAGLDALKLGASLADSRKLEVEGDTEITQLLPLQGSLV